PTGTPSAPGGTPPPPAGMPSAPTTGHTPAVAPGPEWPGAMSETGSFHLPPPQPTVTPATHPGGGTAQQPVRQPAFTGGPEYRLPPPPPLRADVPTAPYTARNPRSAPPAQHRGARRRRRSGPPAKVALPLLLLALACYTVGFWALTRI
ncbi:serine/threonine protein kinase, partial [Streptomyces coelicoflavus]|nr:serine/threonine protein kinase [Streptomyces coelicoflavus]